MKVCTVPCGLELPLEDFGRLTNARDGRTSRCSVCLREGRQGRQAIYDARRDPTHRNARCRRRWAGKPEWKRRRERFKSHLRTAYGISFEQWTSILIEQCGRCALCGRAPDGAHLLHLDHCHETGRVRTLLCARCNHLLGFIEGSEIGLDDVAAYIDTHRTAAKA
jgi:hypothetical protein